jgi:hypothetical protein
MIYKYLNGSRGITRGSKGGAGNGSSGGDPQPYNLSTLADPFFITKDPFESTPTAFDPFLIIKQPLSFAIKY